MLFLKPHKTQCLLRTPFYLFLWQSEILWSETDIGKNIHLKQLMLRILKNKADLAAQRAQIIAFLVNILSIIIDGTARSLQQSVQMLDQRRFAGAGMADHTDELPVKKLQINIL